MAVLIALEALGNYTFWREGFAFVEFVRPDKTAIDEDIGLLWLSYSYKQWAEYTA
jgi:hypothetical protein